MDLYVTHVGTATVLFELGGLRFLTDPALDPPGQRYPFGFGTHSTKLAGPHLPEGGLGSLDAVLLTHDQHGDNLDGAGRALLPSVPRVITTRSAAKRLGGQSQGLAPWESVTFTTSEGKTIRVTATPARHGPPGSLPIVGEVVGFVLEWEGQRHGALYLSGDTVRFAGVEEVARRFKIGTAFLHLGCVRLGISGPLRYTFSAQEGAGVAQLLQAPTVVPIHYTGWTHFQESRQDVEQAFEQAGLSHRLQWLTLGTRVRLEV